MKVPGFLTVGPGVVDTNVWSEGSTGFAGSRATSLEFGSGSCSTTNRPSLASLRATTKALARLRGFVWPMVLAKASDSSLQVQPARRAARIASLYLATRAKSLLGIMLSSKSPDAITFPLVYSSRRKGYVSEREPPEVLGCFSASPGTGWHLLAGSGINRQGNSPQIDGAMPDHAIGC